jgi:hypothetical protein
MSKKITVGKKGDIKGSDNAAIQKAVDKLDGKGGTVEILEGEYECIDGVYLRSGVRLIGQGEKTILKKSPGFRSKIRVDADYGQLKITPEDISGFAPGMGVSAGDSKAHGWLTSTAQITEIKDGSLYFDTHLKMNYTVPDEGFVSNAVSLIKGYGVSDASVENLVIQGNKETNFKMDGCRGGAIYFTKSEKCSVIGCDVYDYNGDAISFQITRDIRIEDCSVTGATSIGLHPGTGSARVRVKNGTFTQCGRGGFFLCWRVQDSVFEDIECVDNRDFGISIGHKDSDNLFDRCVMKHNGNVGLRFRGERDLNGAHRNGWRNCIIEDNKNMGIEVNGITRDNGFTNCVIRSTEEGLQPTAVSLGENTENIDFQECIIEGEIIESSKQ